MVSFEEILFPSNYDYGGSLGPGVETKIISRDSGLDMTNPHWDSARRRYENINFINRDIAVIAPIKQFFWCRTGSTTGFRFHDTQDFTSNVDGVSALTPLDQPIVHDGSGNYRLAKFYAGSLLPRYIFKPVVGTVRIADGGSEVIGGWSVDATTGIITGHVPSGTFTAGFQFDAPVRFDGPVKFTADDFNTYSARDIALRELIYKV